MLWQSVCHCCAALNPFWLTPRTKAGIAASAACSVGCRYTRCQQSDASKVLQLSKSCAAIQPEIVLQLMLPHLSALAKLLHEGTTCCEAMPA